MKIFWIWVIQSFMLLLKNNIIIRTEIKYDGSRDLGIILLLFNDNNNLIKRKVHTLRVFP